MNKIDQFIFLPQSYQLGDAFSRLPQDQLQRQNGLAQIAKRVLEHSNEIKRLLGETDDLSILKEIQ